jgi:5-methylcytosine-specific restriction endonuclease McrA
MKKQIKSLEARSKKLSLKAKMDKLSDNEIALKLRKSSDGFLRSKEWKELRLKALELYGLICSKCGRENSKKYPINVDHIKPRKFFPELSLDITNLQPMCGPCNKKKGNQYKIC